MSNIDDMDLWSIYANTAMAATLRAHPLISPVSAAERAALAADTMLAAHRKRVDLATGGLPKIDLPPPPPAPPTRSVRDDQKPWPGRREHVFGTPLDRGVIPKIDPTMI